MSACSYTGILGSYPACDMNVIVRWVQGFALHFATTPAILSTIQHGEQTVKSTTLHCIYSLFSYASEVPLMQSPSLEQ
jgi:hypothetical protein